LRGLAHAGCFGDEAARIVAGSLRPPQLRIASKIARAPEDSGRSGSGPRVPEVARIEGEEIGIFPL
ncbi:MAG: septum site-determining protein MinC, partial [Capsulimonadales bacterium]|nr:septum site-determining protein MinC [Capsulimonadales bacterium]